MNRSLNRKTFSCTGCRQIISIKGHTHDPDLAHRSIVFESLGTLREVSYSETNLESHMMELVSLIKKKNLQPFLILKQTRNFITWNIK